MGTPTISVIIPTRARPERLGECLQSLQRQNFPRGAWEVVVVDDGSPDPEQVALALAPFREGLDVRLVVQDHAGPATARNTGAAHARFEYLAFTDDDCRPRPEWLSALAATFQRTPNVVLGGHVVNGLKENLCSQASQVLVEYVVDYFLETHEPFFPSNNLALPRSAFEAVGGFDARFPKAAGEDRDLCAKFRSAGIPLAKAVDAVVEHRHAMDLRGFWRQHFNYGRGAFICRRMEATRGAGPFRVEPLRFYMQLLGSPFGSEEVPRHRLRVAALLFLSQAANALGFFRERFSRVDRKLAEQAAPPAVRQVEMKPVLRQRRHGAGGSEGHRTPPGSAPVAGPERKSSSA